MQPTQENADDWDFYLCERGGAEASILVNLGLRRSAPDPTRRWRFDVRVPMQAPSTRGLSTSEERPMLNQIEDALAAAVCSVPGTRFVGRIIRAGTWVFTYYAPRTEGLTDAVGSAMADFPNYSAACDSSEDAEWSRYFRTLLPTHREAQQILDRRVIANLERHGDSLRVPREVKHWVYFRNPYERSRFAEAAGSLGFELCESELADDGRCERRFCAVVSRNDPVDFGHIHQVVLSLLDAAREFDGDYDGWETVILRPS